MFNLSPRSEALALARETAQKALALDADSGAGTAVLGMIDLYFNWDFDAARARLERAVALRPHESLVRHGWPTT